MSYNAKTMRGRLGVSKGWKVMMRCKKKEDIAPSAACTFLLHSSHSKKLWEGGKEKDWGTVRPGEKGRILAISLNQGGEIKKKGGVLKAHGGSRR